MKKSYIFILLCLGSGAIQAEAKTEAGTQAKANNSYQTTINNFKRSKDTHTFFNDAYGYAVFPTIGKVAFVLGGAYGDGQVYRQGKHIGNTTMKQLSIGYSFGGQGYSEIIFFKDKNGLNKFTSGDFEFNAQASAVALNVDANVQVGTTGNSSSAGQSGTNRPAAAGYVNGMAIFTMTKGGLIIDASLAGQQFSYEAVNIE